MYDSKEVRDEGMSRLNLLTGKRTAMIASILNSLNIIKTGLKGALLIKKIKIATKATT